MSRSSTVLRREASFSGRLRRHSIVTGAVISAFCAGLALVAFQSSNGVPFVPTYVVRTVLPAGTPSIVVGTQVRIGGLYAGTVASVTTTAPNRQAMQLSLRLSPVGTDARLAVRSQTLAGQYIAIQRGDYRHDPLRSGGSIPTRQDSYYAPLPTVIAGFRQSALADLSLSTQLAGAALVGRGASLNAALDGLGTTVREATGLMRAISPATDLTQLSHTSAGLALALQGEQPEDAGRLLSNGAGVLSTLAAPSTQLGKLVSALPGFEQSALSDLPRTDTLLSRAARLTVRLVPALSALSSALPPVRRLLASGPRLSEGVSPLVAPATSALMALGPAAQALAPDAQLLASALPALTTIVAYVKQFPQEIQDGMAAYYLVDLYHATVGNASGYPAAPVIPVLTCTPGYNSHPTPGSIFTDHTNGSCK